MKMFPCSKKEKNDYIKIAKERLLGTWKNMEKETKQHIMNLSNYITLMEFLKTNIVNIILHVFYNNVC